MDEQTAEDRIRVLNEIRRGIEECLLHAEKANLPMPAYLLSLALAEAEDELRKLESREN